MNIGMTDEQARHYEHLAEMTVDRVINRRFLASIIERSTWNNLPRQEIDEKVDVNTYSSYFEFIGYLPTNDEVDAEISLCPKKFQESHTYAQAVDLLKEWVEFETMLTSPAGTWFNVTTYEG